MHDVSLLQKILGAPSSLILTAETHINGMKSRSSLPFLLSCSFVRLGGSFRTPRLIKIGGVVPTSSDRTATFFGSPKRLAAIAAMSTSTSTTPNNENFIVSATTAWEDAKAYNTYASAAVDLSNAHMSEAGLFTGECNLQIAMRSTPPKTLT